MFASDAVQLDMDPTTPGVQLTTTPAADTNVNGIGDVEEVLRSLRGGRSGTPRARRTTRPPSRGPGDAGRANAVGPTVMFFVSDGLSDNPWALGDELARLDALGVYRTAWGFGDICDLTDLRRIDPFAQQLTSTAQIVEKATARSRTGAGDGRWLEPGLAGVTIYLDTNGNGQLDPGEPSTVTTADDPTTPDVDETGWYAFTDLPIGTYVVREVVPTGYTQTAPKNPDYYRVDLRTGPIATGYDFGNLGGLPGSIRVHKGIDANRNGVFEPGEPPGEPYQAGVTFYLDYDRDGQKDPGEPTSPPTDSTGACQFLNLAPGDYLVREVVPPGFNQVVPPSGQGIPVHVDLGQTVDVLFVNQDLRGSIAGFKWVDNGNGQHDPGEPGMAGVRIYLDLNGNHTWDSTEPYAITRQDDPTTPTVDETGMWRIDNVVPGTYVVREMCPAGYTPNPPSGFTVTVNPLDAIEGLLFFNVPILPEIIGWKYNDLNSNGRRDRNHLQGDHLVLTVDVSDSTKNPFAGDPPGDVNGDGSANDILDGELAGLIAVNQALIGQGLGGTVWVSIVAFTNVGYQLDMDPASSDPTANPTLKWIHPAPTPMATACRTWSRGCGGSSGCISTTSSARTTLRHCRRWPT